MSQLDFKVNHIYIYTHVYVYTVCLEFVLDPAQVTRWVERVVRQVKW